MLCFTLQISIKTFPAKFYQISSERARVSPFERNWSFCIKVLIFEQKYQIPQRKVTFIFRKYYKYVCTLCWTATYIYISMWKVETVSCLNKYASQWGPWEYLFVMMYYYDPAIFLNVCLAHATVLQYSIQFTTMWSIKFTLLIF